MSGIWLRVQSHLLADPGIGFDFRLVSSMDISAAAPMKKAALQRLDFTGEKASIRRAGRA